MRRPRDPREAAIIALAREHLGAGRPLTFTAEGHSMWPLIQHGDRVVVAPCDADSAIAIGDIALIALADRLVLHRVIAVSGFGITTKGDAVARPDPRVARTSVLGVLPRAAPIFNRVCACLSTHTGRPLAALLQRLRLAVSARA